MPERFERKHALALRPMTSDEVATYTSGKHDVTYWGIMAQGEVAGRIMTTAPDDEGFVELRYAIEPAYADQKVMKQAISEFVHAPENMQTSFKAVVLLGQDPNVASTHILEAAGFELASTSPDGTATYLLRREQ